MINILNKYLVQHHHINIPGLGTLYLERIPAKTDVDNNKILSPYYTLLFDKYFDAPDKAFFTYLASQEKIPDYEAIKLYNQFAQDLRSKIKLEEKAEWKEMGIFRKDNSGEIIFEPVSDLLNPYEPVVAETIISNTIITPPDEPIEFVTALQEETITEQSVLPSETLPAGVLKKDRRWVYALILGAIALVVLLFQVSHYNNFWKAIANHQLMP